MAVNILFHYYTLKTPQEVVVNIHTGVLQPAGKEGLETALPLSQHSQQEGAPTTQPTTAAAVPPAGTGPAERPYT
jgi:hypothetical protein